MKQLNYALCLTLFTSAAWCQQQSVRHDNDGSDDLQIVVIQGEDGANIVQDGTFADTIVEVRDRNNVPIVGGAMITAGVVWGLAAHTGGATPGAFANGSNTITITADTQGRAVISGFRPSGNGPISLQVNASYQGHTGHVTVHQTNFPTVAAARAAGKTPGSQQQANQQSESQQSSSSNNVANSSQVVSHGMSTGMKALLVVGGVGAAGAGAAYAAGAFKTTNSGGGSCSNLSNLQSQSNTFISTINTCTDTNTTKSSSCQSAYNQAVNIDQEVCSCIGSPVPSALLQAWQALQSLASAYGVATPANGSCH
ncbi:MAG: hypothetical protein WBY44_08290 [Bryobacteraceae bacterium]